MELHRLKSLHEPYCLEFLPHHFLLCSTGNKGFVSWQDTSSGKLVASFPTNKGCCRVMSQNPSNAVLTLGHSFGSVTMWTPNLNSSVAQIKAHKTPVSALAFDPSGQYMISAGMDRMIKVRVLEFRNVKILSSRSGMFENLNHCIVTLLPRLQKVSR